MLIADWRTDTPWLWDRNKQQGLAKVNTSRSLKQRLKQWLPHCCMVSKTGLIEKVAMELGNSLCLASRRAWVHITTLQNTAHAFAELMQMLVHKQPNPMAKHRSCQWQGWGQGASGLTDLRTKSIYRIQFCRWIHIHKLMLVVDEGLGKVKWSFQPQTLPGARLVKLLLHWLTRSVKKIFCKTV